MPSQNAPEDNWLAALLLTVAIGTVFVLGTTGIAQAISPFAVNQSPPKQYLIIDNKNNKRWTTRDLPAYGSSAVHFYDEKGNYWHLIGGDYTIAEYTNIENLE